MQEIHVLQTKHIFTNGICFFKWNKLLHVKYIFIGEIPFHFKSSPPKSIYLKFWKKRVPFVYNCTHTIFYVSLFWHHINNFRAFWTRARFTRAPCVVPQKNIQKIKKNPNFWETFALCTQIMNKIISDKEVSESPQKNVFIGFLKFFRSLSSKRWGGVVKIPPPP